MPLDSQGNQKPQRENQTLSWVYGTILLGGIPAKVSEYELLLYFLSPSLPPTDRERVLETVKRN